MKKPTSEARCGLSNTSDVGEYGTAPGAAPTASEGLTHPLATDETGGLVHMMVPASDAARKTPLQLAPISHTRKGPLPANREPGADELRARLLLVLAVVNHRSTPSGLTAEDVADLRDALNGTWDGA